MPVLPIEVGGYVRIYPVTHQRVAMVTPTHRGISIIPHVVFGTAIAIHVILLLLIKYEME